MDFRTIIKPESGHRGLIGYERGPVVALGSCFSDTISRRLRDDLFEVVANPTGTLYNPRSIASTVERIVSGRPYEAHELFLTPSGRWSALSHHSSFSDEDPHRLLDTMNCSLARAHETLRRASVLFVTLGSAYTYELDGETVANCHKLPARIFRRTLMETDEVVFTLRKIADLVPEARVVATVSPIRHLADGLHVNNVSKATLMLGVEKSEVDYFPAYEAVVDDLRDYRFYAADMKHPSELAADYVYDLFCETYMDAATLAVREDCRRLTRLVSHRPADPAAHLRLVGEAADSLAKKYPFLSDNINTYLNDNGLRCK